jgi:hypothetical protein
VQLIAETITLFSQAANVGDEQVPDLTCDGRIIETGRDAGNTVMSAVERLLHLEFRHGAKHSHVSIPQEDKWRLCAQRLRGPAWALG